MNSTLQVVGDSKYGGATYLIIEWCKYLVDNGWDVSVLTTDSDTVDALSAINNLTIIDDIFIPRDIKPFHDVYAFFQLLKLMDKDLFDVVHTYTTTPGFLGRICAKVRGIQAIFHHQAGWPVTEYSSLIEKSIYTPLEYIAALASTRSICVSHSTKETAVINNFAPSRKLVTVCNGIDASPYLLENNHIEAEKLREELAIPQDQIVIGASGRLAGQKDYVTFLHACKELGNLSGTPNVTVVIAGDGPERENLVRLSRTLGLDGKVQFLGFIKNIPAFLSMIDIYVSSSLWEGLSISIMEAMASAKPIIATSIGPNAELIEHGVTGLLVKPKSPEELAKAIDRFVREPELAEKCAEHARQRVLKEFSLERMFRQTMELYDQFLTGKNKLDN